MVRVSDPSTGALLDDPRYGPVVVQSGTTRLFECFIQDARPDTYNITWNIANWTEMGTAVVEEPFGGGLVNVSSFLLVKHPGKETRESNLTCTATDIHNGKSWNSTSFKITFCRGSGYENTVTGVLISLCVAATIAAVIAEIVIYKHYNG
ncbi:uncharacterized protein LOC110990877 [Acanthaster planci]|uniref:Uncharacterized protein LOC110990877 n=1 Tax=Acanthaster planci TaxID=133434 RepID=A0A8B8A1N3_ACAPL|nr:uncharacterized protein LOC110990877 [Acanthaster planci]